jgi:putative tryptophan/tyrosine transport system substrate-binding protein
MPTIGIIHSGSNTASNQNHINALEQALAWAGYTNGVAGFNVLPPAFADDRVAQLDADARNFLKTLHVDVLVAAGGSRASTVALNANMTAPATNTPVIFTSVTNPLSPSPTNMTGICARTTELDLERLKLLHELLPGKTRFGVLYNAGRIDPAQLPQLTNRALILGLTLDPQPVDLTLAANVATQIGQAFQHWANTAAQGVIIAADPLFHNRRNIIISAAAGTITIAGVLTHITPIPAIYQWREFAADGGLISYGPNLNVAYQLAGTYVGQVLDKIAAAAGGGPAVDLTDMPVLPLDNSEMAINLTTAKALHAALVGGFKILPSLLARADTIAF